MTKKTFWLLPTLVLFCAAPLLAADAYMPRWPAISPDGETVAFSFQGDLWTVSAEGGEARRLTAHDAYDSHPVFSPDGRWLAFASQRYGDSDVFIMPVEGGRPVRLTHAGSNDLPRAFSANGTEVYFATRRLFDFPMSTQIWRVPVAGGTPFRLVDVFMDEIAPAGDDSFVYSEGRVAWGRRHYRGSYQRELYSWTPGSDPVRLTDNRGYDHSPMVAPGGRIFWVSNQDNRKNANIWTMNADGSDKRQVTRFKNDDVRQARLSAGGLRMVFEHDTALYVMDVGESKPHKLQIMVADDQIENPVTVAIKSGDANEVAVSSDGEDYALTIDGEIVLVNKELGGRATVPLSGATLEQSLAYRPGTSDTLLFVSDREGEDAIYLLLSDEEDEPDLRLARKHRIERLSDSKRPCTAPRWSPDGDRILYTRGNGDLHVMDHDGSNDAALFESWNVGDYSWSPDGEWVAFSRMDANYNSDIWLMPSVGGEAVNVTRHPDYDDGPVWNADGTVLAWSTARHDHAPNSTTYDVYALYLTREDHERTREEWKIWEKTRDKKKDEPAKEDEEKKDDEEEKDDEEAEEEEAVEDEGPKVVVDFENIHLRARRVTNDRGSEFVVAIHPKGDRYYFTGLSGDGRDLKSVDRFGEEPEDVTEGGANPNAISLDAEGKTFTFLKRGAPAHVSSGGGKVESTEFSARLVYDRPAIRLRTMDEAWRTLRDRFYDADMHGADWPQIRKRYAAMVQGVRHDVDFADVMNFMVGELNASHMGYRARWERYGDYGDDGWLGLAFDPAHSGDGLLVGDVVPYGPCDKAAGRVLVGDVLLAVDGDLVGVETNLHQYLETKEDLPVWLTLNRDGEELEIEVVPTGYRTIWQRTYERTERDKRAVAEAASDGRVGYVHIQGMGFGEVERFEQNLFAAADGKEALIIDVRNNGGGWTTDLLMTILTQPQHAYTIGRDGEVGYPMAERQPFARWSKPVAVICNEGSYSNAEIFSHAIKTLGRGPVVGMETGGNVISTGAFGNRYRGYTRLPGRGWYVFGDESNPERNHKPQEAEHELTGFLPDYEVPLTPADRLHDRDPQLDKAVELMIQAADEEKLKPQAEDSPYLR